MAATAAGAHRLPRRLDLWHLGPDHADYSRQRRGCQVHLGAVADTPRGSGVGGDAAVRAGAGHVPRRLPQAGQAQLLTGQAVSTAAMAEVRIARPSRASSSVSVSGGPIRITLPYSPPLPTSR